ncbi:hypothetical protein tinsulaeT_30370 [Thalassotalea insulae]|uniref:DUF3718 domain-containing protein n=1 Tax=Thalassotalea insulae TaxID=2056778 RepID=A0ABQ6GYN7_9GAMM|nr:hypothetical protein [Thalassotalea insulae]GLX79697.1 hypothetical protein tinsulaeT_30370 [Thalassotalea insulae]
MKRLISFVILLVMPTATFALTTNVEFKAYDQSLASQVCVTAAKDGFQAAKTRLKNSVDNYIEVMLSIKCNGQNLRSFAKNYQPVKPEALVKKSVMIKAADNREESKICAAAVKNGVKAVAEQTGNKVDDLLCNGVTLRRFVARYTTS